MIGSLPHIDPQEACDLVARHIRDIPAWPQLPCLSPLEDMNIQFSEGFPGIRVEDRKIIVDRSSMDTALERLYAAYVANDVDGFPVGRDHAAGLYAFMKNFANRPIRAAKGQLVGPVTWGLSVTDTTGRAILYDDTLGDAVPRFLRLKAGWQEKQLRQVSRRTIIFVDEPYMASYGSAATSTISARKVIDLLNEVFGGISGLKGVHCCGNTDWSVLLLTSADIISFDTYSYAGSLALYPDAVRAFLDKPGAIAWGIVPTDAVALAKESVASLKDRLEEAMAPFTRRGIAFSKLVRQSLLTPSCGLSGVTVPEAERALELLDGVSQKMRQRYL